MLPLVPKSGSTSPLKLAAGIMESGSEEAAALLGGDQVTEIFDIRLFGELLLEILLEIFEILLEIFLERFHIVKCLVVQVVAKPQNNANHKDRSTMVNIHERSKVIQTALGVLGKWHMRPTFTPHACAARSVGFARRLAY
mmetsp:Transcript_17289/g.40761  ORF Transcript_17289/g.40761 Transcript_17289/m.40761 type:complete len:140 (-) Transcript_17289:147-566(-)